jgi:hypothetical protein
LTQGVRRDLQKRIWFVISVAVRPWAETRGQPRCVLLHSARTKPHQIPAESGRRIAIGSVSNDCSGSRAEVLTVGVAHPVPIRELPRLFPNFRAPFPVAIKATRYAGGLRPTLTAAAGRACEDLSAPRGMSLLSHHGEWTGE